MEYLTEDLEPKKVLRYFEEICAIPHGTGNEAKLAQYIASLASDCGFEHETDAFGNLLVRIPASQGAENVAPFLMQAHMDMVCVKEPECQIDMQKEPVVLKRDGNILYAEGTSLGADNAVGMCNMLAVMTDKSLRHPELELLFTVREETGLEGIKLFDMSLLKSRRMLTMDCGDPDVMILGSAGAMNQEFYARLEEKSCEYPCYVLELTDLHGGHTGLEIGSGYANALTILTDVMFKLVRDYKAAICELVIGGGMSCIPNDGKLIFGVDEKYGEKFVEDINQILEGYRTEFSNTEKNMTWSVTEFGGSKNAIDEKTIENVLDFLLFTPVGDMKRHPLAQTQVLGSALLKSVSIQNGEMTGTYTIKSNFDSYKYRFAEKFERLCSRCGITCSRTDDSPAWPEKTNSAFTDLCTQVYEECFGVRPKHELVHGGEEASIVASEIPEMEIVGIAPYSRGAHTTKEYLRLDTMQPIWTFVKALLERLSANFK